MSQKREPGMAYDMSKLNKVFAFLSFALLVTVVWVFLDDYVRPWKAVQLEAMQIKKRKIEEQIKEAEGEIDKSKLTALEKESIVAKEKVAERIEDINELQAKISLVQRDIKDETIRSGTLNSYVSAKNFTYEHEVAHGGRNVDKYRKELHELKAQFADSKDRMKALQSSLKKLNKQLDFLRREEIAARKEKDNLLRKVNLLKLAKSKVATDPVFVLRNAPIIDFMDPTLKIHQIVIDSVTDDRYFQHVPKVDRCITCHTFIDQKGYENEPNPHRTHPNLELMVGAESKHPMKQIGCTVCHGGEGHRVLNFNSAAHIPQNDEQKAVWVEKYDWHEPHKVMDPMIKLQHTEARCLKCHQDVEYVTGAEKLNEGRRNIEKYGCYACHKIEGWEHKRKPGPSLEKIASKVSKDFFKNWVWSPKEFNPHALMPSFFGQTNNNKPEFVKKNIAEVNAIAEYVWKESKTYKPFMNYTGGNGARGKELIKNVGCLGCHGVEGLDDLSQKTGSYAGPYLSGTGTKVKSADWLVSWLKKPDHYQENTIMPSFRLSNKEANDIAAYLLSLKNPKFEGLKFEGLDKDIRDELLVEYFSAFDTQAVAKAKLAKMSDEERTIELGYRSIGKYGCYSCHDMKGFDGRGGIGPELTAEGSKPLTQFGFNLQHDVEHSRDGWIKAHLQNPRRWDQGLDKPFKDIQKMPNYYLTEAEAESMTIALLGQVNENIPLKGVKRLDSDEKIVAEGMKVITKYNCIGCHQIDGQFGDLLAAYEDDINEGPPRLVEHGFRVQTDWFFHFLQDVYPIRPWLNVRMPSFNLSVEERNKIVAMFQAKARQKTFVDLTKKPVWLPGEKRAAEKMFKETLACTSCHSQGFTNMEPSAPDLRMAKRKLRPEWIKKWLENPQSVYPETVMPNFWDGGSTDEETLGGDKDRQINALVKYIYEIGFDSYSPKK